MNWQPGRLQRYVPVVPLKLLTSYTSGYIDPLPVGSRETPRCRVYNVARSLKHYTGVEEELNSENREQEQEIVPFTTCDFSMFLSLLLFRLQTVTRFP
jgi:hypothetical protein